tara:strand:+ start:1096 stop:1227 length:132 start_codon:yes stop_codon:yes gene_type:complete
MKSSADDHNGVDVNPSKVTTANSSNTKYILEVSTSWLDNRPTP